MSVTEDPVELFVVGAGGLLAGEFLRLAEGHPALGRVHPITRHGGEGLRDLHPQLSGAVRAETLPAATAALAETLAAGKRAALLLALPHGESAGTWRALRAELGSAARSLHVVDLSADYRFRDPDSWARYYPGPHPDVEGLTEFAYGLPELGREALATTRRVAAPGCFATALQLACVPAAEAGILRSDRPWILNAITGSSGSGKKPAAGTHHPHRHGNLWAYPAGVHRHEGELRQALAPLVETPELLFLPHSGPFVRGIHLTATLPLAGDFDDEGATSLYTERFLDEPFLEVLADRPPDLHRVVGSNRVSLATHVRGSNLVVHLALDNVIKGGAGQALQCLNLLLGLPEVTGLPRAGMGAL